MFDGVFGWLRVTVGELVSTEKVTGALSPAGFPGELPCVATAVYWPLTSEGLALLELHAPPVPVAMSLETSVPSDGMPAWLSFVTASVRSLAVLLKVWLGLFGGVFC